jgi:hypothetical protein
MEVLLIEKDNIQHTQMKSDALQVGSACELQ